MHVYTNIQVPQGEGVVYFVYSAFFLWIFDGGDSKFLVSVGPRWERSRMGGGGGRRTCEKNLTAHLLQN